MYEMYLKLTSEISSKILMSFVHGARAQSAPFKIGSNAIKCRLFEAKHFAAA
jgi:hypothetical protein